MINFDKKKGKIKVQSGILLKNLLEKTIPDGWSVPVSPGTKYVSIGGMVVSNVHGKNQHGTIWYGTVRYGTVQHALPQCVQYLLIVRYVQYDSMYVCNTKNTKYTQNLVRHCQFLTKTEKKRHVLKANSKTKSACGQSVQP